MNLTQIWKLSLIPEVEFFKAHFTDFAYAPHFHEDYAIGVVESGVHAFNYRGQHHAVTPGHVITCQPGEIHTGHAGNHDAWRYSMLYLHPSLVQQVAVEIGHLNAGLPFLSETEISHPMMVQAVRTVHQHGEQDEALLSREVAIREMLALMLSHYSEKTRNPTPIRNERAPVELVKAYIAARYADDVQLAALAQVAHLSKTYLIRAFRSHVGMSPHGYLIQIRLSHARRLLKQGRTAADAAVETGFFDQSHFSRYFKRCFGVSPGQYRRAIG